MIPAYVQTWEAGLLRDKVDEARQALRSCRLCPRQCEADRLANVVGVCRSARDARVSAAFPHFGEEDVLRGGRGSGTIFFAGCNLRCVFCQNFETSQRGEGAAVRPRELARMMLQLQERGCHNINLVTPEPVVAQILESLPFAIEGGLRLPIVYNTSAYDSLHSIALMGGVVDVYMPDFKLWDGGLARRYLLAPDYPEVARQAIAAMHAQVGDLQIDADGLAARGLLVRHLVMPGLVDDTREIMAWLASLSRDTYVNLMEQYSPAWRVPADERYAAINREVEPAEMGAAYAQARAAGLWRFDRRWRAAADRLWDRLGL